MSKSTPDIWDLRVRERNLNRGDIKPKGLDEYLSALPDLEAQSEPLELDQPAFSGAPDDDDDDDDDDAPGGDGAS